MKLKKLTAVLLVSSMALSLTACSGEKGSATAASASSSAGSGTTSSASSSSASSAKSGSAASNSAAGEADATVGTVDEDVDYAAGETYKFVYICSDDQTLMQQMLEAYKALEKKYNFTIEYVPCEGVDEVFVTNLQTLVDRGDVDGLIVESNTSMSDALLPILQESGIPWINQFTEFYDEDGNVATPTVIIPQWQSGYDSLEWICQNYKDYWGDVDPSEVGLINVDFSTSQPLADRTKGINDCFIEYGFPEENIFVTDSFALGEQYWMTLDGGYQPTATTVAAHPEIKYWMMSSCLEYYAQGAARAAEDLGINDSMLISDVGSPLFIEETESGYEGAWKCCIAINNYAYATPIILGLRALCDGRATAETLWPDKHDYFADHDAYGTWRADYSIVTKDTYKDYLEEIEAIYGP